MTATLQTPLTQALGCRLPIIQTAMGWVATPELVAASVSAGAMGFLAAAVMTPEECASALKEIKRRTSAPFGVNLHSFQPGVDRIVDACIEHRVAAISYGRAPSARLIDKVKQAGILCVPTIGAAKHAKKAVALGADVLVCQGGEGGGHTGETPTWLLLAQVLDMNLGVPVVACGGFRDGRGLAAALTFGADGIAMGTRFLLTADSPTPEATKARYLEAEVTRIRVSTRLDGLPQRMIVNQRLESLERASRLRLLFIALNSGWRFKRQTGASLAEMLKSSWAMARQSDLSFGQTLLAANSPMIIQNSMVHGRPDEGVLPSGQVAGLIDDLPTCTALLDAMVIEARERLAGNPARTV
ncbi:MAG: nitronate monooxygenase [Gammaproteobacteria bacterium]|nr:nitronate monooxygenase [Gammaproteobacteria bacterium]